MMKNISKHANIVVHLDGTQRRKKNKPSKVLRYFPLKPRLQRFFMCSKVVENMRLHSLKIKDGFIRHPRDGEAWKTFSLLHPDVASDPRNVRLSLASDGFNPCCMPIGTN